MMRCEAFEELLHPWLDGFLDESESEAMRAHAAGCPTCAQRVQALREALEACAEAGAEAEVPATAAAAWRQAVRAEAKRMGIKQLPDRRMSISRLQRVGGWALSVAAGLIFLLGGARLVHEGALGWPREGASAPRSEMASPQEAPPVEARIYQADASDEFAYGEYAADAEPMMGGASAKDAGTVEEASPMAEAEMSQALEGEALEEEAPDGAGPQASSLAASQAPQMLAKMSEASSGQARGPVPNEAEQAEPAGDGGSGFAHYLLDMVTFAMMSLPLVVAGGIVYVILRRALRRRTGGNTES